VEQRTDNPSLTNGADVDGKGLAEASPLLRGQALAGVDLQLAGPVAALTVNRLGGEDGGVRPSSLWTLLPATPYTEVRAAIAAL